MADYLAYDPRLNPETVAQEWFNSRVNDSMDGVNDVADSVTDLNNYVASHIPTLSDPAAAPSSYSIAAIPYESMSFPGLFHCTPVFQGESPAIPAIEIPSGAMPAPFFSKPELSLPSAPDVTWPEIAMSAPSVSAPDIPSKPGYTLPALPSLDDVVIPAPPSVTALEFEGAAPDIDLTPPVMDFEWNDSPYTSVLVDAIKARFEQDIALGGQGFGEVFEQAQYDRDNARVQFEDEDAYREILAQAASRGWVMPPGEMFGQMTAHSRSINQRRSELNAKILSEQTAIAQKNTHFAMETAVKIEAVLLQSHSKLQQRSFEAAKFALDGALELYRAKVDAFRAQTQTYSVLANVYETRIRAEIGKAEVYKIQIEGVKVGIEAYEIKVQRYKAQLGAISALMQMYRAEMQSAHILADIERTRMQTYKAQVEGYKARIEGVLAQANGYVARMRGEESKADMVKTEARAYKAHVNAYRTQAEVELERVRANIEGLKARVQLYLADVKKYSADVDFEIGIGKADQQYSDAVGAARVLEARYDGASKDLAAAVYNANTILSQAAHRMTAIVAETNRIVSSTTANAALEATLAGSDAQTMLAVATASILTSNNSTNTRDTFMDVKSGGRRHNVNRSSARNEHYGHYHKYEHD